MTSNIQLRRIAFWLKVVSLSGSWLTNMVVRYSWYAANGTILPVTNNWIVNISIHREQACLRGSCSPDQNLQKS